MILSSSPLAFGPLNTAERGWLQLMKNMELLVEEAAVTGDYGTLLQAFTLNPLIPSGDTAVKVMEELLVAHKRYLPQFAEVIKKLEEKGVTVSDPVARELCEKGL